jgi:hypothetical protein
MLADTSVRRDIAPHPVEPHVQATQSLGWQQVVTGNFRPAPHLFGPASCSSVTRLLPFRGLTVPEPGYEVPFGLASWRLASPLHRSISSAAAQRRDRRDQEDHRCHQQWMGAAGTLRATS